MFRRRLGLQARFKTTIIHLTFMADPVHVF